MSKPPSSLAIRVRLADEDGAEKMTAQEEVIILWDRIVAAALLLALLIGLLFIALQYWRSGEKSAAPAVPTEPVVTQTDVFERAPPVTVAEPVIAEAPPSRNISEESLPLASEGLQQKVVAIESAKEEPLSVPVDVIAQSGTAQTTDIAIERSAEREPAGEALNAPVDILSANVLEAHLATEMRNRKPLNSAPTELTVSSDELLTVYFAVELEGYRATRVSFNWYRNDHKVATVPVRPKHDVTSTYSSKYINELMGGDWRVELTDQSGETLASGRFHVRTL